MRFRADDSLEQNSGDLFLHDIFGGVECREKKGGEPQSVGGRLSKMHCDSCEDEISPCSTRQLRSRHGEEKERTFRLNLSDELL